MLQKWGAPLSEKKKPEGFQAEQYSAREERPSIERLLHGE